MTPEREAEIRQVMDLTGWVTECLVEIDSLRAESKDLRGAMESQDEREREAGERCGVPYAEHGCDWPEWIADAYLAGIAQRDALRAKLAAVRAEREWQPIATAPKDVDVLVLENGYVFTAACMDDIWSDCSSIISQPTHWMPMPPAPSEDRS